MTYVHPVLASKYFPEFEANLADLSGKTIAVTGTTSGTGLVFARTCARKGARVLMLNRKSSRSDSAQERVKAESPSGSVETIECDLMSFDSVRAACAVLVTACAKDGLDVLCCNAGIMAFEDKATVDGYDVQMQTNHLSHFLLAREAFPLLEAAAARTGEARIVSHSSGARMGSGGPLGERYLGPNGGDLGGNGASMLCGGARWKRYGQTKLANSVFTQALHERLQASGSKVKAVCCAPGGAVTDLQATTVKDGGLASGFASWMMSKTQSAEDGTMPLLLGSVGPAADVPSGGSMFEPTHWGGWVGPAGRPKALMATEKRADSKALLWEMSEKAVGAWPMGL